MGFGFVCIIVGLVLRMLVASVVPWGLKFKKKEKAFVAVTWIPKGTVQVIKVLPFERGEINVGKTLTY